MISRNLYNKQVGFEPGEVICVCYFKHYEQIVAAIKEKKLVSVQSVGEATKAGTNCGRCQPKIQQIIDETLALKE